MEEEREAQALYYYLSFILPRKPLNYSFTSPHPLHFLPPTSTKSPQPGCRFTLSSACAAKEGHKSSTMTLAK